jgi:renal tumor antigen
MNSEGVYNYKRDIWAIGCIFFELLAGYPLFPGKNEFKQKNLIQNFFGISHQNEGLAKSKLKQIHDMIPKVNESICNFIQKLLSFDPNERPTSSQALENVIFLNIRRAEKFCRKTNEALPFPIFYRTKYNQI